MGGSQSGITEIDFRIAQRWWQNGALHLAVGLFTGLLMIGFLRWRMHLLVTQKHELESAVMRRTEDLQQEKTELLRAREQMRHYAEHDDLTGLSNHRIIIDRLRAEADRSYREHLPLSLILVDLDHFKKINDTYGHPTGDLALKAISTVFQSSVRSYDWVGRYGGEEFLLILPGSTLTSARIRAEQMRMAIEAAHISDNDATIHVTASFGVASGITSNYQTLLKAADKALYAAKDNGRNCVMAVEIGAENIADRKQ
jgi:diguanylate cyclase (GGDEF)-like protein